MRDDFRRHVLQFYNRSAASYELLEFIRRRTRHEAVTLSGWHPGEKVLDLCTGTGELALAFARHGAEVVGIDIARGMLRRAAGKCEHLNPAWVEMDATALSFETKSFDVSSLSLALHHMPESARISLIHAIPPI